ncbi:DoxX family protein [Antrihabitans sp. NCIMB 15449]|uniref:DoxX family protein n=1 Tax=Antrihabitans spumae TaxID=3373370 RepID=A0ABW7JVE3_9NOCA
MLIRRIARPLMSTIFIAQGIESLRNTKLSADATRPLLDKSQEVLPDKYSSKVPTDAEQVVRINAAIQIAGGALLATNKAPRLASIALAGTLVPGNLGRNAFWNETDPQLKAQERTEFLTGLSLLGGLMIAAVDTEGKPSLGWRGRRAARRATAAVSSALPIGAAAETGAFGETVSHGLHAAAERSRALAEVARERGPVIAAAAKERGNELAEVARERGPGIAAAAKERGSELAEAAAERGRELGDYAREHGPELAEAARNRSSELAARAAERGEVLAEVTRKEAAKAKKEAAKASRTVKSKAAEYS